MLDFVRLNDNNNYIHLPNVKGIGTGVFRLCLAHTNHSKINVSHFQSTSIDKHSENRFEFVVNFTTDRLSHFFHCFYLEIFENRILAIFLFKICSINFGGIYRRKTILNL